MSSPPHSRQIRGAVVRAAPGLHQNIPVKDGTASRMALADLLTRIEDEARRAEFPLDRQAYAEWGRDPLTPILAAGSLDAPVCSFGRELGRDEVRWGQPQVGAAGKLVRRGVLAARGLAPSPGDPHLEAALEHVLLTNTVPYKPPRNRAYPPTVKERFRAHVECLLLDEWQGDYVVTLGTEAFFWFAGYLRVGEAEAFWAREDRYEADLTLRLAPGGREIRVGPLPHPSPLNRKWVARFPSLLLARLAGTAG